MGVDENPRATKLYDRIRVTAAHASQSRRDQAVSTQTALARTPLVGQSGEFIEHLCNQLAAGILRLGGNGKKLD